MNLENYTTMRVRTDKGVPFVTLDHGELNLLDLTMLAELDRLGRDVEADPAIKVLVFQSANPDFFVAHADLDAIAQLPATPPPRAEKLGFVHGVFDRFRTMPKVTIARIEGRCRGGGSELALACDMRFAALGRGVLCQTKVGVGIIPGAGGTVRLPRLVGRGQGVCGHGRGVPSGTPGTRGGNVSDGRP
jgi:enoyl-CoA hydratase/carnithine racemase